MLNICHPRGMKRKSWASSEDLVKLRAFLLLRISLPLRGKILHLSIMQCGRLLLHVFRHLAVGNWMMKALRFLAVYSVYNMQTLAYFLRINLSVHSHVSVKGESISCKTQSERHAKEARLWYNWQGA